MGPPAFPFGVKINDREVIASGSLIVHYGESIAFSISDLVIQVVFETVEGGQHSIDASATSEKNLRVALKNFNNSLGTTVLAPLAIGNLNGRPFYASFAAHAIGDKDQMVHILHYTFSLGPITVSG